jgi:hypothetical protein
MFEFKRMEARRSSSEVTEFVIVLNSQAAVNAFARGGNVQFGGALSVLRPARWDALQKPGFCRWPPFTPTAEAKGYSQAPPLKERSSRPNQIRTQNIMGGK